MSSRTVLILGASSDLGCQLIRRLSRPGLTILAHYHANRTPLDELARTVDADIVPVRADFTQVADLAALADLLAARPAPPDGIVHLPAPKLAYIRFKSLEWDHFGAEIDIQLRSIFMVLKAVVPAMAERKSGKVVFVLSSVTDGAAPKAMAHYTTAKYAMLGFMKSLVAEYGAKNLQFNAVSPSMMATKFLSGVPEKFVELTAENTPLKRLATVDDVVPAIELLLSPGSDYMNGVNLPITGGA